MWGTIEQDGRAVAGEYDIAVVPVLPAQANFGNDPYKVPLRPCRDILVGKSH